MFKEIFHDEKLPSLKDNIDKKPYENINIVLNHLKSGEIVACAAGRARDVFTDKTITEELKLMTDGKYEWRSDIIFYVEKYNLRLPDDFEEHCLTFDGR